MLFVWALEKNEESRLNTAEIAFMVYGLGFALEKVATMQEHGLRVYFTGTWVSCTNFYLAKHHIQALLERV